MDESLRVSPDSVRIFSGQSHWAFAQAVAEYLNVPLSPSHTERFSNDNLHVQLGETVRGRAVFIVQSLVAPVSDHVIELLMMIDAARTAGAKEVHAIIPYFSYARSDKKDKPRISIAGRLMARLIAAAGATHVMTMSLHAPQVHGFFDLPTDPLTARPVFQAFLARQDLSDTVVVAPDAGRAGSATRFAEHLGLPVAVGSKTRLSDQQVRMAGLIGDVSGKRCAIIYDDEIARGTTVVEVAELLRNRGVGEVKVVCTHGVFTGNALGRLSGIPYLTQIVTTDTVPQPAGPSTDKLCVLSVAPLFGEALRRNCLGQSIGNLFSFWKDYKAED